jgi:hypothetical protein
MAAQVEALIVEMLEEKHVDHAILVSVHLRRGDGAMGSECHGCVSEHEPDVHNPVLGYRMTLDELDRGLHCINAVVQRIRLELGRPVAVRALVSTGSQSRRRKAHSTLHAPNLLGLLTTAGLCGI